MYLVNRHLQPVLGIDIHFVNTPVPLPIPHPYIGLVVDIFDYLPLVGSTIKVNGMHRGNTQTTGKLITFIHIPFGAGFTMPPIIGHEHQNFFGCVNVHADGSPLSGSGYMTMSCNDIGIPLSISPGKKMKPIPSLYLPTSFVIPLPMGPPVMVGAPLVPDFSLMSLLKGFMFGSFLKIAGKLGGKLLKLLNHAVLKKSKRTQKLSAKLCKHGFEPIDLITGRVFYEATDFELPGPLPLTWERYYDSDSVHSGMLGIGNSLWMDRQLELHTDLEGVEDADGNPTTEGISLVLPDGRTVGLPMVGYGESFYHPQEKLTLRRLHVGGFVVEDHAEQTFAHFTYSHPTQPNVFRLTRLEDYSGFAISLDYHGQIRCQQLTDSAGRVLTLRYNTQNLLTHVYARPSGQHSHALTERLLVAYDYDTQGHLTAVTDAAGQTTSLCYDAHHHLVSKTDRQGQTFYWEYDSKGRCTHTWGEGGWQEGWIQYVDEPGESEDGLTFWEGYTEVTNALGETTTYFYDETFRCIQQTDHYGASQYSYYDPTTGELTRQMDEEGLCTAFRYDENGNLSEIIAPDGNTTHYHYSEENLLSVITLPDGSQQTFGYDDAKRVQFINEPTGQTLAYEYGAHGLIEELYTRTGQKATLRYDADWNLTEMTLTDGNRLEWQYDAWGQCIESHSTLAAGKPGSADIPLPAVQVRRFAYDVLGRVKSLQLPDGNHIELTYNAYEEVISAQDNHTRVEFSYTPLGSLTERRQNGQTVRFAYDAMERLCTLTNEAGKPYFFGYNKRGEVVEETGFDGLVRQYHRDRAGKVIRTLRPGNRYTEYQYDAAGRIQRAEHYDGTYELYGYDANGQLASATNADSHLTWKRNKAGYVTEATQQRYYTGFPSDSQMQHAVHYTYDRAGNRSGLVSSLGAKLAVTTNMLGQVTELMAHYLAPADSSPVEKGTGEASWSMQLRYNAAGQEIERILPGGVLSQWEYDPAGRPLTHKVSRQRRSGTVLESWKSYSWKSADRLTEIFDQLKGSTTRFKHDAIGNLIWALYASDSVLGERDASVAYQGQKRVNRYADKTGNLYETDDCTDRKYSDAGALLEDRRFRYQYDAEGNLIEKLDAHTYSRTHYSWNGNGSLKSVTKPDGKTVAFKYDALGRRIEKVCSGQVTRWVWDGNVPLHEWSYSESDQPVVESSEWGELSFDKPEPVQQLITWVFEENSFVPCGKIVNGQSYSIVCDYLGTPQLMFDESGEKVWEAVYDIYGRCVTLVGKKADCPFRYQGQYEDSETGLYYNRFRYYDCQSGQYVCQDPIKLISGEPNLHKYVTDTNIELDGLGLSGYVLGQNLLNAGQTHGINPFNRTSDWQAHHLIPEEVWGNNKQFFKDIGVRGRDNAKNGIFLPSSQALGNQHGFQFYHSGSHGVNYSPMVAGRLARIENNFRSGTITAGQAKKKVEDLQKALHRYLNARQTSNICRRLS